MRLNRREIIAACAALVGTRAVRRGVRAAETEKKPVETYQVDFDELVKAFPNGTDPSSLPPLLARLGEWMNGKPWRSIGAFDLALRWSDTHFPGAEFQYDQFALIIRLPDGSAVGYWLAGRDPAHAPIVLLGSEGDFATLAPDLETLLARIALGDFRDKGAGADFLYSDEDYGEGVVPDLRGALQGFLRAQTGIQDLRSLVRAARPYPSDFAEWVAKSGETYDAQMQAHPAIQAMAPLLDKYRPVNAKPWQRTMIRVTWADTHFAAWLTPGPVKALAESAQLKPYLAALRDEAAARMPGLGLWHQAALRVSESRLELVGDYLFEPAFRSGHPPAAAFKADQARAPRVPRRVPRWLAAILAS